MSTCHSLDVSNNTINSNGLCKFKPPVVIAGPETPITLFPQTLWNWGCAEFKHYSLLKRLFFRRGCCRDCVYWEIINETKGI